MEDRRKNLYCGPGHKVIPTLSVLANYLECIQGECRDSRGFHWDDRFRRIDGFVAGAIAEVDKLILKDIPEKKEEACKQ